MAIKRGGGGKGKKNFNFCFFVFILLPSKNVKYLTLKNLSTYGHITLKFVGWYFYWVVTKFSKNRAILAAAKSLLTAATTASTITASTITASTITAITNH